MRLIKMLGLAMVAMIAVTAFIGAGSASAAKHTFICGLVGDLGVGPEEVSPCGLGLGLVTHLKLLLLGEATLTSGFVTVKCKKSEMELKITETGSGGGNVKGEAVAVSWSECSSGCGSATAQATKLPWAGEIPSETQLIVKGAAGKFTTCGVTCEYEAEKAEIKLEPGLEAMITATKVPLKKIAGSGLCSSTATWSGLYDTDPKHILIGNLL